MILNIYEQVKILPVGLNIYKQVKMLPSHPETSDDLEIHQINIRSF